MRGQSALAHPRPPLGLAAMGAFSFFGPANAGLTAITLLWRATALDQVWLLNPFISSSSVRTGGFRLGSRGFRPEERLLANG